MNPGNRQVLVLVHIAGHGQENAGNTLRAQIVSSKQAENKVLWRAGYTPDDRLTS
jgi:hypothetical protein